MSPFFTFSINALSERVSKPLMYLFATIYTGNLRKRKRLQQFAVFLVKIQLTPVMTRLKVTPLLEDTGHLFVKIDFFEFGQFQSLFSVNFTGMFFTRIVTYTTQSKIGIGCIFIPILAINRY
jgi:hypothetical protein